MRYTNKLIALGVVAAIASDHLALAQRRRDGGDRDRRDRDDNNDGDNNDGDDNNNGPFPAQYFGSRNYQRLSGEQKVAQLWQQALADESEAPAEEHFDMDDFMESSMQPTFRTASDEMPPDREKYNHGQGVMATFEWVDLGNHTYTGIYDGGATNGIIRLSEGNNIFPESSGLTPTMALKFLIDGEPSTNILANTSFEPSNSWNFFANDFRTRVDFFENEICEETVQRKFLEVTSRIHTLSLSEMAVLNNNGSRNPDPEFPFNMWFQPSAAVADLVADQPRDMDANWWDQVKDNVPADTVIFNVMAQSHPDDPMRFPDSAVEHIADIRLTSDLILSTFGDARLFFQHHTINRDHDLEPEWRGYVDRVRDQRPWGDTPVTPMPEAEEDQEAWVRGQAAEYGCPFAWLLGFDVNPIYE